MHWVLAATHVQPAGLTPGWIEAFVALSVAVVGVVGFFGRLAWQWLKRIQDFLDDYFGQQARPGVPAKPGVMLRLKGVEDLLGEVSKQMTLNGGHSMHDTVKTTANDVKTVKQELATLSDRVELFEKRRGQEKP